MQATDMQAAGVDPHLHVAPQLSATDKPQAVAANHGHGISHTTLARLRGHKPSKLSNAPSTAVSSAGFLSGASISVLLATGEEPHDHEKT